jgi:hypothetical protein
MSKKRTCLDLFTLQNISCERPKLANSRGSGAKCFLAFAPLLRVGMSRKSTLAQRFYFWPSLVAVTVNRQEYVRVSGLRK